jgi:hypothetical protein
MDQDSPVQARRITHILLDPFFRPFFSPRSLLGLSFLSFNSSFHHYLPSKSKG